MGHHITKGEEKLQVWRYHRRLSWTQVGKLCLFIVGVHLLL